jgi:succinate-semialdehyde dehydrogenase/glutarate-semialdehyde dehydrogenase
MVVSVDTGRELESVNPATLERIGAVPVSDAEEVAEAVARSREAQRRWAAVSREERAGVLLRAGYAILDRADEIAELCTRESGKPVLESLTSEVFTTLDTLHWLAAHGRRALEPERVRFPQPFLLHKRATLEYEPLGVIGIVPAWNFPFAMPAIQVAAALLAGNGAVVKPAEQTPLAGQLVQEVLEAGGAPRNLVRVVHGGAETGAALVGSRVDKVVFTGSVATGRAVATACAARLTPYVLELGGKDAMLVLDDADVERAVDGALWAGFCNAGQVCASVERIFVAEPLHERFVERLVERASGLRVGNGAEPGTQMGPLIDERQYRVVESLVQDAEAQGGAVLTGGRRAAVDLAGWFYAPTVVDGLAADARLNAEETFGPVVTVTRVAGDAEAIRLANAGRFGLGASVWTTDRARGEQVGRRLEAGSVWVNNHLYSFAAHQAPWGGVKDSGSGRSHSKHGLYELSNVKYLERDPGWLRDAWWYPYDERGAELFHAMMGALYGHGLVERAGALWHGRRGLVHGARRMLRRG